MGELIPATLQARVQSLYSWRNTFVASQASILAGTTVVTGDARATAAGAVTTDVEDPTGGTADAISLLQRTGVVVKVDRIDIDAANAAVALFHSVLVDVYETNSETLPSAAGTEWDSAFTDLQTDFSAISTLIGSNFWRTWSAYVDASGASFDADADLAAEAAFSQALLSTDFDGYMEKWRARLDYVRTLGGVSPDFEGATRPWNDVWQDQGGTAWFESQDGLLPIQPGYYYHSAVMGDDDEPVSTQEFGIGVGVGCPEFLVTGDKLIITISPTGNLRVTYQVGDQFRVKVVNGSPVQLGGGQTGTDTQTWRVLGSVDGVFNDYSLYKPTPNTYSASGLTFLITPGGIDSALGDEFEFYIEGGQFRYRKNGGAWSSNTQIAASVSIDTASGANVAADFATGAAPSFVIGDIYSFSALALHTVERITSPVNGGKLSSSPPGNSMAVNYTSGMLAGSTSYLFARNNELTSVGVYVRVKDAFGANLASVFATLQVGDNAIDLTSSISGFADGVTVTVAEASGSAEKLLSDLWIGHPFELDMPNAVVDPGITRTRVAIGTKSRPRIRYGASVQHVAVASSSVDDLIERLNDAAVNHEGRFAAVWPAGSQTECGIVRFAGTDLELEDEFDYQPEDSADRLLRFTLPLEAVA